MHTISPLLLVFIGDSVEQNQCIPTSENKIVCVIWLEQHKPVIEKIDKLATEECQLPSDTIQYECTATCDALKSIVNEIIGLYQCGIRLGESTIDRLVVTGLKSNGAAKLFKNERDTLMKCMLQLVCAILLVV